MQQGVHLFTDGSCLNPAVPVCRLAAWAVVFADVEGPFAGSVVDSGPLPGMLQNSYRAEIFAVWRALSILRLQSGRVFIWTDSGAVVTRLRRLLQGGEPKPNGAHSDLWFLIVDTLRDFAPGQVEIRKVAAHQKVANAVSPAEDWCTVHNTFADHAANLAQWRRSDSFWAFFGKHVMATKACTRISREVQHVLLRISRAVVRENDGPEGDEREAVCVPPEVPDDAWRPLTTLHVPATAVRWYGDEVVRLLLSWYWQATFSSTAPVIWMSQFHLYIDFMMSGEHGPTKIGIWRAGHRTPNLDLLTIPFQTRCRWFSRVLKECLKHHGQAFTYRYCRPHSRSLFLHTGCIAVPWDPVRVDAVDDWILTFCPNGVQRTSRAVDGLPFASKDCRFPEVLVTTV
jgi:ribonuclease HI